MILLGLKLDKKYQFNRICFVIDFLVVFALERKVYSKRKDSSEVVRSEKKCQNRQHFAQFIYYE